MNDQRIADNEWHVVHAAAQGQSKIYCSPQADICFGWIDLADFGQMALMYFPSDTLDQLPAISARLETLLRDWKTDAETSGAAH